MNDLLACSPLHPFFRRGNQGFESWSVVAKGAQAVQLSRVWPWGAQPHLFPPLCYPEGCKGWEAQRKPRAGAGPGPWTAQQSSACVGGL